MKKKQLLRCKKKRKKKDTTHKRKQGMVTGIILIPSRCKPTPRSAHEIGATSQPSVRTQLPTQSHVLDFACAGLLSDTLPPLPCAWTTSVPASAFDSPRVALGPLDIFIVFDPRSHNDWLWDKLWRHRR